MINLKNIRELNQKNNNLDKLFKFWRILLGILAILLVIEYAVFDSETMSYGEASQTIYLALLGVMYFVVSVKGCYEVWKREPNNISSIIVLVSLYAIWGLVIANITTITNWLIH